MAEARIKPLLFVPLVWLFGRLVIVAGFLTVPHLDASMVGNWDGLFYREIVTRGYEFTPDGWLHDIAFFPLFPALTWIVTRTGIGFYAAGVLVNNACYLAMLFVVFDWVRQRNGESAAAWTVAFLSVFPLSLFGSVIYSEGTYMLLTALALREFERRKMASSSLWSALASCTRPNGFLLAPALALAACMKREKISAFLPAAAATIGLIFVVTFSWRQFGDPLAFFHAQQSWRPKSYDRAMHQWLVLVSGGSVAFGHWVMQLIALPLIAVLLRFRDKLPWLPAAALWAVVVVIEQLCWGRDFPFAILAIAGTAALITLRKQIGTDVVAYGLVSLAAFVVSGTAMSVDRILFGVIAFPLAIGLLLQRLPALGPSLLLACVYDLYVVSTLFIRNSWVA